MIYFETIKCFEEDIFNLSWHEKRIAKTIGLNINLADYIYPPSSELLKCKVTYDKNGILDILFAPYSPREINSFKLMIDNNINYKYKSTNRKDIDNLFDNRDSADEIIIIKNNLVTDTSIANIAVFIDNSWITPKIPLLEGTCRNRLIHENKIIEKDISLQELINAEKIALMNAMIDFKIINNFDIINKALIVKELNEK